MLWSLTDNWVLIVSNMYLKLYRLVSPLSALLNTSFSSRTHSRRRRRYQRSDLDSSPCQSSREDRYTSTHPYALPWFLLSVFWVAGRAAEMTDKTDVMSLSQLHRKLRPLPSASQINKPNFDGVLRNLSVYMRDAFYRSN